jgi:hypothetical protein
MSNDLFERAARNKFRYTSPIGPLSTEQLFDLPLTGRGANLDNIARQVNSELQAESEQSFVATKPSAIKGELEAKLEIVKAVIARKIAAAEATATRAAKADKRRRILDALDQKENEALTTASREELLKELEALDA